MRLRHSAVGFSILTSCLVGGVPSAFAVGSVSLSTPANGGWTTGTPRLIWTSASQATSYTLTLTPANGAPLVKTGVTTTSYTLTEAEALSTAGGPYTWSVTAYDAAAASSKSSTWSFFVDTTPPEPFALTGPELNRWTKSSDTYVEWAAATDSGSGIAAYHAYIDGVLCRNEVATATSAGMTNTCRPKEGVHYWSVSVEDKVGNLTWSSDSPGGLGGRPFRVDDTGPADPSLTGGVFQLSSNHGPNYYSSPTDHMVDTGINVNSGQEVSVSATGNWCVLGCTSGCYSVDGYYSPTGGGVPVPGCYNYSLVGRVNIGSDFYCLGSSGTLTAGTSGKLYLGINSQNAGCWTPTVTATVIGGRQFGLVSPADNIATSERLPIFTWMPAFDQGSSGVRYHVFVDMVTSGNAVVQLINATTTHAVPNTPLADGTYEWTVSAFDAVSNRTDAATRKLTIDTLRPASFTLSTPGNSTCTTVPTPSLCWNSATDATGITSRQLWIDGALAVTSTTNCATPNSALTQGTHTWFAVLTDAAGNARQSSDTRRIVVDYTAPSAPTLLTPASPSQTIDPPVFSWTAANDNIEIKTYELYVDGVLNATLGGATLSYTSPTEFSLGAHSWYVRALDQCGQAALSSTSTFTVTPCAVDGLAHPCPGYTLGPCRPGTRTCTAPGTWSACSDFVGPTAETCNGEDEDCNGIIDDGTGYNANNSCGGICSIIPPYLGSDCDGPDADHCAEGRLVCAGLNQVVCVETTPNNVEVCNGRDDDCNGTVDDGSVCANTGTGGGGGTNTGGTSGSGGFVAGGTASIGTGGALGTTGGALGTTGGVNSKGGSTAQGGQVSSSLGGVNSKGGSAAQGGQVSSSLGGGAGTHNTSPVGGSSNGGTGGLNPSEVGGTSTSTIAVATGGADTNQGGQGILASAGASGTKVKSTGGNRSTSNRGGSNTGDADETSDHAGSDGGESEASNSDGGCSCRVAPPRHHVHLFALIGVFAWALRRQRGRKSSTDL